MVDTNGLLLKVQVHPAHVSDSQGGQQLLMGLDAVFPRLRHLWADGGYFQVFVEWVRAQLGWTVSVVKPARRHTGVMDELARLLMTPAEYARVVWPWLPCPAPPLGGRAHLRLVGQAAPPQQGLRASAQHRRGLD